MAEIWFCFEGEINTRGGPDYLLSLAECEAKLGLFRNQFIQGVDIEPGPHFADTSGLAHYAGPKHVVVKLDTEDVRGTDWQPGYYHLDISPEDATERLR